MLTLIPWDADVHQRLGSVLLQNGEYAKALVQYNEALRYDRSAIPPRLGVARVLIAQQRFAEARGLLTAVLQLDAENEEADRRHHGQEREPLRDEQRRRCCRLRDARDRELRRRARIWADGERERA